MMNVREKSHVLSAGLHNKGTAVSITFPCLDCTCFCCGRTNKVLSLFLVSPLGLVLKGKEIEAMNWWFGRMSLIISIDGPVF